jgi:uncharacterized protein (DUF3084 family)
MSISASTLLILFTADRDVRQAVFQPEIHKEIQSKSERLTTVNQPQVEIKKISES